MLSESDVARRRRCTEGARVVFIGTSGLGSMVMRGKLMHSVLEQTFSEHGVRSSYVMVSDPSNSTAGGGRDSAMLEGHFDQIGGPSACIILKYSVAWVGAACRRRGALVLVDSIDNYRAFKRTTLTNEHYGAMDAILVQTRTPQEAPTPDQQTSRATAAHTPQRSRQDCYSHAHASPWAGAHASLLASWGHTAVVLPQSGIASLTLTLTTLTLTLTCTPTPPLTLTRTLTLTLALALTRCCRTRTATCSTGAWRAGSGLACAA